MLHVYTCSQEYASRVTTGTWPPLRRPPPEALPTDSDKIVKLTKRLRLLQLWLRLGPDERSPKNLGLVAAAEMPWTSKPRCLR